MTKCGAAMYTEMLSAFLEALFIKHPPTPELNELMQKNVFSVPNQRASDVLISYLYSVIDEEKYSVKHPYPLLDKKIENNFYTQVHKYSKEISDEYPDEHLPKVVKSFFIMPSGERYMQFMYKLMLIAMKNDLKADGIVEPGRPKDEDFKTFELLDELLDEQLKQQMKNEVESCLKKKNRKRLLKSQIKKERNLLRKLKEDLKVMVEKCSLPDHMKSIIISGPDQKVIKDWYAALNQTCEKLKKIAECMKNIKFNISQLNERTSTLRKRSLCLGNKEQPNGQLPEDFLNNLLRRAEGTLNVLRVEGPLDLSPCISDLEELTNQFKDMMVTVANCSQLIVQLHDETQAEIPQLEAALFSNEQLEAKDVEESADYGHSLMELLHKSTPPEMLRNLRIAALNAITPMKNHEIKSQIHDAASRVDAVNDGSDVAESCTPVTLDTSFLKPISIERKCGGSTWKHALLLSTLKKKQQQKENPIFDFEGGRFSLESLTDTPLAQPNKRTTNPVKSLNNLWAKDSDNCGNYCSGERVLFVEAQSDDDSPEKNFMAVYSAVNSTEQNEWHLSSLPDSKLGSERMSDIFPELLHQRTGTSSSVAVKPLFIQEQSKVDSLIVPHKQSERHSSEEDCTHISEAFNSGNLSQEIHNFFQAWTNSNGSLMGASSAFGNNSSPLTPDNNMSGIIMLEQISLDMPVAKWNDEQDLTRILNVALSPAGIIPGEVRSSTPINTRSSVSPQPDRNEHQKEGEKPLQLAPIAHAMSRIPRSRLLSDKQSKVTRNSLFR